MKRKNSPIANLISFTIILYSKNYQEKYSILLNQNTLHTSILNNRAFCYFSTLLILFLKYLYYLCGKFSTTRL